MSMWCGKRLKLEKQLMQEIKTYAHVSDFPISDAKVIADLIVAYNRGDGFVELGIMAAMSTLDKYPNLCQEWDNLMIKYHKLGLFPKWNIHPLV